MIDSHDELRYPPAEVLVKWKARAQDAKMKELILHISKICQDGPHWGAIKLNKILFYADFLAYLKHGKSITGQEYFALSEGPAPRQLVPIRRELCESGHVALQTLNSFGFKQARLVVLKPFQYKYLEAEDVALVDQIIKKVWQMTGAELSTRSHDFAGWKIAFKRGVKTTIPYAMARFDLQAFDLETPQPPASLIEYGRRLWRRTQAA